MAIMTIDGIIWAFSSRQSYLLQVQFPLKQFGLGVLLKEEIQTHKFQANGKLAMFLNRYKTTATIDRCSTIAHILNLTQKP